VRVAARILVRAFIFVLLLFKVPATLCRTA
jgi:hypothetical protein